MSKTIERRFLSLPVEIRQVGDAQYIEGYAARFFRGDKKYQSLNLGNFKERLAPGCFGRCLATNPDVKILRDHNPSMILGRCGAGTGTVSQDDLGLRFRCQIPDTTYARDMVASIQRGDITGCSFGFTMDGEPGSEDWSNEWDDEENCRIAIRTINTIGELLDCSVVTDPGYPATSVQARELWPAGVPASVRSHAQDENAILSYQRQQRRNLVSRIIGW